ncbi:MAG: hypothetical protein NTX76_04065 [Alphaproteobacteria bacterium]|nr:hypothetical protein [Alphaproteobacteria bacterium]
MSNSQFSFNRFFGGTLIVSGTTIGAGMLALPMTSMTAGFSKSILLLFAMWAFMCLTALITLEANLHFKQGFSIAGLAEKTLGSGGRWVASFSIILLSSALLAAYITGGTGLIQSSLDHLLGKTISFSILACLYTACFGFFVNACTKAVDYVNRILFTIKMIIFVIIIVSLAPHVRLENLQTPDHSWSYLSLAVPVFFTSFGFHGSIPSIINYVGPHPRQLRWMMIIGSFFPFAIYFLWQLAALGTLHPTTTGALAATQDLPSFINSLTVATGSVGLGLLINGFAFLAIATSFLGVSMGLFDFIAEQFKWSNHPGERLQTSVLTFGPPLFFALFYPNGFLMALGYAAIALSILAVLLPVAVAWKIRQETGNSAAIFLFNKAVLVICLLVGIGVIAIELFH